MVFALIHCSPILPDLAEGVNRQFLPAFCQFWRNAEGRLAGIWRPARQCARSGAVLLVGRARRGRCQAEARLQTALEKSSSQSVVAREADTAAAPGRRVGVPPANLQSQGTDALDSLLDAARQGARSAPSPGPGAAADASGIGSLLQRLRPRLPEADEGLALRFVEGVHPNQ